MNYFVHNYFVPTLEMIAARWEAQTMWFPWTCSQDSIHGPAKNTPLAILGSLLPKGRSRQLLYIFTSPPTTGDQMLTSIAALKSSVRQAHLSLKGGCRHIDDEAGQLGEILGQKQHIFRV
jgi:hypothetical protein